MTNENNINYSYNDNGSIKSYKLPQFKIGLNIVHGNKPDVDLIGAWNGTKIKGALKNNASDGFLSYEILRRYFDLRGQFIAKPNCLKFDCASFF